MRFRRVSIYPLTMIFVADIEVPAITDGVSATVLISPVIVTYNVLAVVRPL